MNRYNVSSGKLKHCPFCGKKASWYYTRELGFVNKASFECNYCEGRISINENDIKNSMAFDTYNTFDVESTGKFNYGILSTDSSYDVITLIDKSNFAYVNSEKLLSETLTSDKQQNNSSLQDSGNDVNNQDSLNNSNNTKKATVHNKYKLIINSIVIIGGIIACCLIYFNFIK